MTKAIKTAFFLILATSLLCGVEQKISELKTELNPILAPLSDADYSVEDSLIKISSHINSLLFPDQEVNDFLLWFKLLSKQVSYTLETDNQNLNEQLVNNLLEDFINKNIPFIETQKTSAKYVVIIPGSGEKIKQWKPEYFIEICKLLNPDLIFSFIVFTTTPLKSIM